MTSKGKDYPTVKLAFMERFLPRVNSQEIIRVAADAVLEEQNLIGSLDRNDELFRKKA